MLFTKEELILFKQFDGSIDNFIESINKKEEHEKIINIVCNELDITFEKLIAKTRERNIVITRQILIYLLYYYTSLSIEKIGKMVGDRDHSSVIFSVRKIKSYFDVYSDFRKEILAIEEKITATGIERKIAIGKSRKNIMF